LLTGAGEADPAALIAGAEQNEPAGRWRQGTRYDALTGLPNSVLFTERVENLLRTTPPHALVGLCFLDLYPVNTGTRQVSDALLVALAQRLDRALTTAGHLFARLGDNEFVVLVTGPDLVPGAAAEVAGQVVGLLTAPFRVGEHDLCAPTSISVVERRVGETTYADLLSCAADLRMRQARSGDPARWMAVDLDCARALVRR
jgi:GGDEF domain-containing protein